MKKILIIFIILSLFTSQIYADDDVNYDKYKTNVSEFCDKKYLNKNIKFVININDYESA